MSAGRVVWLSLAVTEKGPPGMHCGGHTHKAEAAGPDQGPSDQVGNILGFSLFSWPIFIIYVRLSEMGNILQRSEAMHHL